MAASRYGIRFCLIPSEATMNYGVSAVFGLFFVKLRDFCGAQGAVVDAQVIQNSIGITIPCTVMHQMHVKAGTIKLPAIIKTLF